MSEDDVPAEAIAAISAFGEEDPTFREAWDAAVRDTADTLTAHVTGHIMAGRLRGELTWDALVPYPEGMSEEDVDLAYRYQVRAEVLRRLTAMGWNPPPGEDIVVVPPGD